MNKILLSDIVKNKLCNSCGACYGVCPTQAIRFEESIGGYYFPKINENLCNSCGLCTEVCPGFIFGRSLKDKLTENPFSGQAIGAFIGRSLDTQLFENSQSGGVVSALLDHSLEQGRIKSAVTVGMESGSPPRPIVRIVRNKQEIFQCQKSKYCPVPLLSFIRNLETKDCPLAVVGLSCHIHGLYNIMDKIPKIRKKILFTIGLVCDRTMTYAASDYLILKSGISKNESGVLHFRDKMITCYPGDVHFLSDSGKSVVLPSSFRMQIKDFFTPARCRICFDKMNVFSDITVGDPHGLKMTDCKSGESMFVTRTELGMSIVQSAITGSAISIRPIQYDRALCGQNILTKKEQWRGYVNAWRKCQLIEPNYFNLIETHTPEPVNIKKYFRNLIFSFKLDDFISQDELLNHVNKVLKITNILSIIFYPLLLAKKLIKRINSKI